MKQYNINTTFNHSKEEIRGICMKKCIENLSKSLQLGFQEENCLKECSEKEKSFILISDTIYSMWFSNENK